jgi:signal peptide peptidase SppA
MRHPPALDAEPGAGGTFVLNLLQLVAGRPWAIQAEVAFHVRGMVAREGIAALRHLVQLRDGIHTRSIEAARGGRRTADAGRRAVAVVPIIGTLTHRPELIGSEMTRSTAAVAEEVRAADRDPNVTGIVLEVDSPGGEVFGVPEAWAAIRGASKPVVASVNGQAGSAAYYLASAAREVVVTPSGEVGSVGVFALHVDASKALDNVGESWEFIVASDSPFKVEHAPDRPLSDAAREALQSQVDRYMAMFVRDLAQGRGVPRDYVKQRFGRGRMVGAEDAVRQGMADRVGGFDVALRRARGEALPRQPHLSASADAARELARFEREDREHREREAALERIRSL